ncbi:tetracycline resistance MFS efflux pump [Paraferrimonas sedimenticola]|uniref:Tetracycline resistance MFS efflux pump n=2 Tax=Paraferrimonas sedimenticola TaxID=375674 RepID=A0AA37RVM7_9GAMM|nr:tetracycline resistance MFS efflux pump [Paraferrimonas sedimenticola]
MLVAFLDSMGFGIVIPVFLLYTMELGAGPELATAFFALYPIAHVIASPYLGMLSDRYGRKPVLALALLGASAAYLLLGFTESLLLLAIARLLQGFMAGNLAVVQAYAADISSSEQRAKLMGKIGAATGLGFVLGPSLGAWLAGSQFEQQNMHIVAVVAAALCFSAFLLVILVLPESLPQDKRQSKNSANLKLNPFREVPKVMGQGLLMQLFVCALLFNLACAFSDIILPLFAKDAQLVDGPNQLSWLYLASGVALTVTQYSLIAPLTQKLGERGIYLLGTLLYSASCAGMLIASMLTNTWIAIVALALGGMGIALFFTGLQSLVSKQASSNKMGSVMGAFSSFSLMGRVAAPLMVGVIYAELGMYLPYAIAIVLLFGAGLLGLSARAPAPGAQTSS